MKKIFYSFLITYLVLILWYHFKTAIFFKFLLILSDSSFVILFV
jgi:hypothetical protein